MTPERKKALILIATTFIVGIISGALILGLVMQKTNRKEKIGWREGGREAFIQKILTVMDADASQEKEIRPLIEETMTEIDSVQAHTDKKIRGIIDSLEVRVKPLLKEEQLKKLQEFHKRGRIKN
ncbi:MAG: hypothetical protein JNM57_03020 [Cyclobacteriaceae bacterium]|nr:hypothetical protein [Cyclobacteriaceae bacterium]